MRVHSMLIAAALAGSPLLLPFAGCAPERHEVVPAGATLGAEGEKRLAFTTDGPGTLYVTDQSDNRLVYSGAVDGKRQITVDPERNEVAVDGTLVQDKTLVRGHNHRIFFQPRFR